MRPINSRDILLGAFLVCLTIAREATTISFGPMVSSEVDGWRYPPYNPTIGALGPRSTVATFTKTINGAVATAVVTFSDMDAEPTCKDKHALPNYGRRRGKKNRRIDVDVDVDAELMMWA
ncbi:hypothetical protein IWZ01DRAFT_477358 [Phyllosticta capitalensis]